MNLTQLKASAELAKTSQQERDNWGDDIDPDDVLRLVEVARLANSSLNDPTVLARFKAKADLHDILRGIEP